MSARKYRITISLEKSLYHALKMIAEKEGKSISRMTRELISEALEVKEDRILEGIASRRERTFNAKATLSGDEIWKR